MILDRVGPNPTHNYPILAIYLVINKCVGEKGAVSSSGCSKEDENNKSREENCLRLLSSEEEEINQLKNYNKKRGIKSGLMRLTWR